VIRAVPAVQVSGLVKRYGDRTAVDGISFEIQPGEVFALLGPNGAGKTSTVETIEGFRRPDGGQARVLGLDPISDAGRLKQRIGIMLQEGGLYPAITPREALNLFSRLYARTRPPKELLETVGLQAAGDTRWRRLSGGEKQRLKLALALLPEPEVVFLDEPTAGMDPVARRKTWEIIERLRDSGTTVVLTTHYLEEAEHLADRVAIVVHGRLAALDTPGALIARDVSRVTLRTARPTDIRILQTLASARSVRSEAGVYLFDTDDAPALLTEITTLLRPSDTPITELRVGAGSLEDVFLSLAQSEESS
jgi:ABC-2 type transport system ATP-binding protein